MRKLLSILLLQMVLPLFAVAVQPTAAQVVGDTPTAVGAAYGFPKRTLPSLPLATGAKVMGVGHSFMGRGTYSRYLASQTATNGHQGTSETPQSYLYPIKYQDGRFNLDTFAQESIDMPWRMPVGGNAVTGSQQGLSGDHLIYNSANIPGTINRSSYALARKPDIIVLDIGTNDISSGLSGTGDNSIAAIIAHLDRQISLFNNAGVWVVIKTAGWRFDWAASDARLASINTLNNWILKQSSRYGVKVWDTTAIDATASSTWGTGDTAIIGSDGVHPSSYGATVLANSLMPILQSMVTAGDDRNVDPLSGNLFPYAGLPGTSGGKATGITGNVATGFSVTRPVGTSTAVASKEVIAIGNEKQVLTITSVNDGTTLHQFRLTTTADISFTILGVAEGDWVQVLIPIELNGWDGWTWNASNTGGGPIWTQNEQYSAANALIWETNIFTGNGGGGRTYLLDVKLPVKSTAGANRLRWTSRPITIQFRSNAGGIGVVKIGSPIMRKISDPRAAWSLP
jgi:Lysophospholipase L1 and related esterases